MKDAPTRFKLTGDAKKLWDTLAGEYGTVMKERHKPLLFAMCQQWQQYLNAMSALKRNKDPDKERQLYYRSNGSLKMFQSLSKQFAMGINDQLLFTVPGEIKTKPKKTETQPSRLGELLAGRVPADGQN